MCHKSNLRHLLHFFLLHKAVEIISFFIYSESSLRSCVFTLFFRLINFFSQLFHKHFMVNWGGSMMVGWSIGAKSICPAVNTRQVDTLFCMILYGFFISLEHSPLFYSEMSLTTGEGRNTERWDNCVSFLQIWFRKLLILFPSFPLDYLDW